MKKTLKERKREDIINAAITEFRKNGYIATNMDLISKTAWVSKRTVYNHFEDKNELFLEVLKIWKEKILSVKETKFNKEISIENQLINLWENISKVLMDREFIEISRIVFSRYIHSPENTRDVLTDEDIFLSQSEKFLSEANKNWALEIDNIQVASIKFIWLLKIFWFFPQIYWMQNILNEKEIKMAIESTVRMFLARYKAM